MGSAITRQRETAVAILKAVLGSLVTFEPPVRHTSHLEADLGSSVTVTVAEKPSEFELHSFLTDVRNRPAAKPKIAHVWFRQIKYLEGPKARVNSS